MICNNCKEKIPKNVAYCNNCGHPVQNEYSKFKNIRKKHITFTAILTVVLFAAIAVISVLFFCDFSEVKKTDFINTEKCTQLTDEEAENLYLSDAS
ncbi:MAG: hypothetical protein LUG24_05730 [Clostridiales bacterium]|nr:hypothetical protein [Clostridiales bacterium]